MDRIWLHQNKVIFTAGVLCGAAIVLLFCIYSSALWLEVELYKAGESQIGRSANGTTSLETHRRNTHIHRGRGLTITSRYLFSSLELAEGEKREKEEVNQELEGTEMHTFLGFIHAPQHRESSQDRCGGSSNWLPVPL